MAPISWLGYRAYSMFLIHQPVAWYVSEFLTKALGVHEGVAKLTVLWTVGLVVVMAVGQVLFLLVEMPCIRWTKRTPVTRAAVRPNISAVQPSPRD